MGRMADAKPLIIVESPAKARTISKFLGSDYTVESSVGHIRDLPPNAEAIPKKYKKEPWARLGIDVNNGFVPLYVVPPDKKKQVATLKKKLKGASELYLATDEDREGEAIAWHLVEELKPKIPVKRLVFHEITNAAIDQALRSPRDINSDVDRVLDAAVMRALHPTPRKRFRDGAQFAAVLDDWLARHAS